MESRDTRNHFQFVNLLSINLHYISLFRIFKRFSCDHTFSTSLMLNFEIEPKLTMIKWGEGGRTPLSKSQIKNDIKFKTRERCLSLRPRRGFDKETRGLRAREILSRIKKERHRSHCVQKLRIDRQLFLVEYNSPTSDFVFNEPVQSFDNVSISCVNSCVTVEKSREKLLLGQLKIRWIVPLLRQVSSPLFKVNRSSTSGSQLRNSRFVTILSSIYMIPFYFCFLFLILMAIFAFVAGGESCKPSSFTSHCAWCVLHILHRKQIIFNCNFNFLFLINFNCNFC